MSNFKNNKFLKFISAILDINNENLPETELSKLNNRKEQSEKNNELNNEKTILDKKTNPTNNLRKRLWKKDYLPMRNIKLWAIDAKNNPCFLILFGEHKIMKKENYTDEVKDFLKTNSLDSKNYSVLNDCVKYTGYQIIRGIDGHLPSFDQFKIIEEKKYDYKKRKNIYYPPKMYYKNTLSYYYSWNTKNSKEYEEFYNIDQKTSIEFSFSDNNDTALFINELKKNNIDLKDLKLINPKEILQLYTNSKDFTNILVELFTNDNIYMRKKLLDELLAKNPSKEFLVKIMDIASSELISGLFLELAKLKNPVLLDQAKEFTESKIDWLHKNYADGLKRCANIYIYSFSENKKLERAQWINENISNLDLHLKKLRFYNIIPNEIIDGFKYRQYYIQGALSISYSSREYDYSQKKYVTIKNPANYESGAYTDGINFNKITLKNTLQECEIYGLDKPLGKIAYYLDAPRLTYYLKANDAKALNYFRNYLIRIINNLSELDENKFINSMKELFSSYKDYDYLSKHRGNFQFNKFIKYYLYYEFNEKPPERNWRNHSERSAWFSNDQLLKLEGRYEYKKEIWDKNIEAVLYIISNSEISTILKAFYYILKESKTSEEYLNNLSYDDLIKLSLKSYKPISDFFIEKLNLKLSTLETFDSKLMLTLIGINNKSMNNLAMNHFKKTNGYFSPELTADFLLLQNINSWSELFITNLESFNNEDYTKLMLKILNGIVKYKDLAIELPQNILDSINLSLNKLQNLSDEDKSKILLTCCSILNSEEEIPKWLNDLIENMIFSFSYDTLKSILDKNFIELDGKIKNSDNYRILILFKSIKNSVIPTDSEIIDILDFAGSKIINMLIIIIENHKDQLQSRFSTLLLLFESTITQLNQFSIDIFNSLESTKQKKLHSIFIDSPVDRTYTFGLNKLTEIYGSVIPKEFIIQMFEHSAPDVKAYISSKIKTIFNDLDEKNISLFMYYTKTLLLLPNKKSIYKDDIYRTIPSFARKHTDTLPEIESLLLDIGGSNTKLDSERALVTLAKIRKGGDLHAS